MACLSASFTAIHHVHVGHHLQSPLMHHTYPSSQTLTLIGSDLSPPLHFGLQNQGFSSSSVTPSHRPSGTPPKSGAFKGRSYAKRGRCAARKSRGDRKRKRPPSSATTLPRWGAPSPTPPNPSPSLSYRARLPLPFPLTYSPPRPSNHSDDGSDDDLFVKSTPLAASAASSAVVITPSTPLTSTQAVAGVGGTPNSNGWEVGGKRQRSKVCTDSPRAGRVGHVQERSLSRTCLCRSGTVT